MENSICFVVFIFENFPNHHTSFLKIEPTDNEETLSRRKSKTDILRKEITAYETENYINI